MDPYHKSIQASKISGKIGLKLPLYLLNYFCENNFVKHTWTQGMVFFTYTGTSICPYKNSTIIATFWNKINMLLSL